MATRKQDSQETSTTTATVSAAALKPALYDADDANPTFARFYPEAKQLLLTGKGLEPLFNWLEADERLAIVDFGARASRALLEFDDNTGFFAATTKFNTTPVLCYALAPDEDSIGLLKDLVEKLGESVQWLIVRSTFKIGSWEVWEQSKTRKRLEELHASEMLAPTLDVDAWAAMGKKSSPAKAASEDKELTLVVRSYIYRWREKYAAELEAAARPMLNTGGKTLFMVTGEKGGVGKSSFARALTDWLLNLPQP